MSLNFFLTRRFGWETSKLSLSHVDCTISLLLIQRLRNQSKSFICSAAIFKSVPLTRLIHMR
jgi:hypothetical protein